MRDGFFRNDEAHQLLLVKYIRYFRPSIVIANAIEDRHPDHGRGGRLIADACFLSGLRKIETEWEGTAQAAWRPKRIFHMVQDRFTEPTFIVDISDTFQEKMAAIRCYKSQFHDPASNEPMTYIATDGFMKFLEAKDTIWGKRIGTAYGEGFVCENITGVSSLDDLLLPELP
jgi:bacillithiol biosynthesis deacetylase BshB1